MATLGHIAMGMAAARLQRPRSATTSSLVASMLLWSLLSAASDLDVIGFRYGIEYGDPWGHRGATHSLGFSLLAGLLLAAALAAFRMPFLRTAALVSTVLASHALLDTLTDGGLGCALLWPFADTRYFAPWNPIPVAPIGRAFLSSRGLSIMVVELLFFLPLLLYSTWPRRTEGSRPPSPEAS